MFQKMRIVFTVLCAVLIMATFFLGIFFDFKVALIAAALAGVCFFLVVYFKRKQEEREHPPEEEPDFFHPVPQEYDKKEETESRLDAKTKTDE